MTNAVLTCLGCGSELGVEVDACPACGVEIADRCSVCEQPVHASFVYCPACGDGIGSDERKIALASPFRRLRAR